MSYAEIRRGLILAAFLIPVSVVSLAEPPSDPIIIQEEGKPEQAEQQSDPEPVTAAPVAPTAPPPLIEDKPPEQAAPDQSASDKSKDYKKADLDAQVRMAEASEKLVKVAGRQLWATIGEVGLLFLTVAFTAIASIAAAIAARAAEKAVTNDRAWMTSAGVNTGVGIDLKVSGANYAEALIFIPRWKNSGRTPAINLLIFRTHKVMARDAEVPNFDHGPYDAETSKAVMGPDVDGNANTIAVVGQDFNDVLSGVAKVIVYSSARYNDVFAEDTLRLTEVCYEIIYNGDELDADGKRVRRFETTPVGPQNRAK